MTGFISMRPVQDLLKLERVEGCFICCLEINTGPKKKKKKKEINTGSSQMKRQKSVFQMKEQDKTPEQEPL